MKNCRFGEKIQIFEQTITFRRFHQLFGEKVQKVAHLVKKHEKSSIWPKHSTFQANYHLSKFWPTFPKKVAKSCSFRKKAWKIVDLAKTCNFSSKLSRFEVLTNFSEQSVKKRLISWKTMKNRRFGQNLQVFEQTIRFRGFDELFGKKVAKGGSFREKVWKIMDVAKTLNFSRKLSRFQVLTKFSEKSCKKWLISWKSMKDYWCDQNFQLFEKTMRFRGFWRFFRKKVAKSGWFREKAWKLVDLAKTLNSLSKLSCFEVLTNFSEKSCKKWLISWKTMKNRRFGENVQLFEQTITFRRFDQLFGKKLQKVAHFVKKHNKSSIWPKHSTFWVIKLSRFEVLRNVMESTCKYLSFWNLLERQVTQGFC